MRTRLSLAAVLALVTAVTLMAAENLRIVPLVHDPQVLVSVEMSDAYTDEVKDTIASGLRVTFTYDVQLRMVVAGWVDRTVAAVVVNVSDQYRQPHPSSQPVAHDRRPHRRRRRHRG